MHKCQQNSILSRLSLLALLLFFSLWSLAQKTPQLRFEHITVQQGLANSVVYSMLQDRSGFLWFATDNGLSKYDGYKFTTYKRIPGDTTSLTGNSIISLLEDHEGYLWIGMMGQGLCRFDKRTEKFIGFGPNVQTLKQGSIQKIAEDQEGKLWVVNGSPELRRFDRQTGEYSRFNFAALLLETPVKDNYPIVNTVYRDQMNGLWIGSQKGLHQLILKPTGVGKPAQVTFRSYPIHSLNTSSLLPTNVKEIYQDHTGVLWVITDKGLHHLDKRTGIILPYPFMRGGNMPSIQNERSLTFKHIAEDQQGYLWIGTNTAGLFRLNPDRTQFVQVQHDPNEPLSLSGKFVSSLLVDRSGLLWVGIWGEGVDKANPSQQPFQHFRHIPGNSTSLSNKYVDAILEDRTGTVWIGTGAGLDRLDIRTGSFTYYPFVTSTTHKQADRPVNSLLEDRDGNLWIGSRGDLAQFNRETGKFTSFTQDPHRFPGLGSNIAIFTLFEDRQGLIWLGTNNGIKSFDRKSGTVKQYPFDPQNAKGISDGWALAFEEDERGNLWVGTGSVALNCLDRKTGLFTHYRPDPRKPGRITSDAVYGILSDSKGNVWFGTFGGGLCRFDYQTETFHAYTQADGLADNSITSIEEDDQGHIWLATKKGLSRFSYPNKTFINYDVNDGLQNGYGKAHCKGRSGLLYFGGENGFTSFDPRQLTTNRHIPPVVITQIKLFDKPLIGRNDVEVLDLRYDENFFSFEFATLNFANPAKNQYAYQLAGLEKDWVYSGSLRSASYTNLAPGTYIFRVKGSNNDGVWNQKGLSIHVIIHPPWWQTIWFRLLAGTFLILTVVCYIHLYTKSKLARSRHEMKQVLQAEEGERRRLAADLHDDLGATLAAIKGQLEILHQTQDAMERPISLMEKALRDLRHISHNLMPPEFAKIGLTEALRETVHRAGANSGIHFLFITYGQERRLDNEIELTIYRIAMELIQNAIRHAQARHVTIQLIFYPEQVSLLVEDDGKGYTSAGQGKDTGIGLRNIHSRATYLKSKLLVDSGERGTTVTLEVPLAL